MSMSDPVADMLTRMRNAQQAHKDVVAMPSSKIKVALAGILKKEGYIDSFRLITKYEDLESKKSYDCFAKRFSGVSEKQPVLLIQLKYHLGKPVMSLLKRVSKPGHRVYKKSTELPKVMSGLGIAIISTPKGVLTDHEARRKDVNVGGEIMCYVA